MFFDANPDDFQPLEKDLLDAMLEAWELELFPTRASASDSIAADGLTCETN